MGLTATLGAQTLPETRSAGVPIGAKLSPPQLFLPRRSATYDAWDLSGALSYADGGDVAFNGCRWGFQGGGQLLKVGEFSPARVSVVNGLFDASGLQRVMSGAVQVERGSSFAMRGGKFLNAARTHLQHFGNEVWLERVYFGAYGLAALPEDHQEAVFFHCGDIRIIRCAFDLTGMVSAGGNTGAIYFEASVGPITALIDGCEIGNFGTLAVPYAVQVAARPYDATIVIRNTAIEKGRFGYVGPTEAGGKVRIIDGGGNTDFKTGAPINLGWPADGLDAVKAQRDALASKLRAVVAAATQ